jgi:hypothetical protein
MLQNIGASVQVLMGEEMEERAMTYTVPPKKPDPKPDMVDCTDRPELIAACNLEGVPNDVARKAPIGGWFGGRFLVYKHSLRQFRGLPVEFTV